MSIQSVPRLWVPSRRVAQRFINVHNFNQTRSAFSHCCSPSNFLASTSYKAGRGEALIGQGFPANGPLQISRILVSTPSSSWVPSANASNKACSLDFALRIGTSRTELPVRISPCSLNPFVHLRHWQPKAYVVDNTFCRSSKDWVDSM